MLSTRPRPEPPAEMQLRRLAEALGVPLMGENSAKLIHGALLMDRFLLSVPVGALSSETRRDIVDMAQTLGLAVEMASIVSADLEAAEVLHFGYEGGRAGAALKLYCEFPDVVVSDWDAARRERRRLLVHRAVKWDPDAPGRVAVSRYFADPSLTALETADRIAELLGPGPATDISLSLFHRAAGRLPAQERLFLEVEEEGTPRRSFDLKLYDAGFLFQEIGPSLAELAAAFDLDRIDRDFLLTVPGSAALGHISGGIGRDGDPFFTLYYGGGPR